MIYKDLKTLAQEGEAKVNAAKSGLEKDATSSNVNRDFIQLKQPVKCTYTYDKAILKSPSTLNEEMDLSIGRFTSNGQTDDVKKD